MSTLAVAIGVFLAFAILAVAIVLLVLEVKKLGLANDDHENRIDALEQGAIRSKRQ